MATQRTFAVPVQVLALLICTSTFQLPCRTGATIADGCDTRGGQSTTGGTGKRCVCILPTHCMGRSCVYGQDRAVGSADGSEGPKAISGWRPGHCDDCYCGSLPPVSPPVKPATVSATGPAPTPEITYLPDDDPFPVPSLPLSEIEWPVSTVMVAADGQADGLARRCTREMMTVVIPTYGSGIANPTLLWQYEVLHPVVCELILTWERPHPSIDDLVAELRVSLAGIRLPVRINLVRLHSDATLSNRFGVGGILRADAGSAILSADDDILIRPQGVAVALAAWKRTPDRIVGGTTCGFASGKQKKAAMEPAFAGNLAQNSWRPAAYSPVFPMMRNTSCVFQLTGFAILHKNYLGRYWSREPAMREARAYVAAQLNAEDLLMNFVVERHVRPSDDAAPPGHPRTLVGGPSIYIWRKMRMYTKKTSMLYQAWFNLTDDAQAKATARKATGISESSHKAVAAGRLSHSTARTRAIGTYAELLGVDMYRTAGYSIGWSDECPGQNRPCNPDGLFRGEPKMDYQTHEWKVWDMGTGSPGQGAATNRSWTLPAGTPTMLYKTVFSTIPV